MGAVAKRGETAAETINFRLPKAKKALIDEAANALGKKRSVFMLDALSEKAHEVLADRTRFELGQRQANAFNRLLDEPVDSAAIRLLLRKSPWDH